MTIDLNLMSLGLEPSESTQLSGTLGPSCWPPNDDFPVLIGANGNVVSRYSDPIWDFSPWTKRSTTINFGNGPQRKGCRQLDRNNADKLRQIMAWWLWAPRRSYSAMTLVRYFSALRPIFLLCSQEGISAADISRFPRVCENAAEVVGASGCNMLVNLLHSIYLDREGIGFYLMTPYQISRFSAALPDHQKRQTAYIPPRIWMYQISRLRGMLDDFLEHSDKLFECYRYCADIYRDINPPEGITVVSQRRWRRSHSPIPSRARAHNKEEDFDSIASRFGIKDLFLTWSHSAQRSSRKIHGITALTHYCTMLHRAAIAYILNFSMMRISEAWCLKAGCLETKEDHALGKIHFLRSRTTKTIKEDDACWIVSPSVHIAVEVLETLAKLRADNCFANESTNVGDTQFKGALCFHMDDPWSRSWNSSNAALPCYPSYADVVRDFPRLFDPEQLRITEADIETARLVTPNLDEDIYKVGAVWHLRWHQLRRTGAVNMQASGLVSDASIQFQLKHATRAMSLYYVQGYSFLGLNRSVMNEYLRTMYEIMGKQIAVLLSDDHRFISPYGVARKIEIFSLVSERDHAQLAEAAKAGEVNWRRTQLGGCTKRGTCSFGGVDNIIRCGGGDGRSPCADALYDRRREKQIRKLGDIISTRLAEAEKDSPERQSLEAQLRAVENVLDALKESE